MNRLGERLAAEIAANGPISVADYMQRCLHDPQDGYYATRPALGADGDFITAPMVSQMFGELIGLWAVETWRRMGSPSSFVLVELGPGEGALMSDLLRAARLDPAFVAAARLYLVETSEPLIERQRLALNNAPLSPTWVSRVQDLRADAPIILVANEFLDCLPARQFVRTDRGWAERCVGLGDDDGLAFGLRPAVKPPSLPDDADIDVVWECVDAQAALGAELGERIAQQGGAALLIDYGRDAPGPGDTLQALSKHQKVDPLADPGVADLTVWADFPAVLAAARKHAQTTAILSQGSFLQRLGVRERAAALSKARPDRAETIQRQLARLTKANEMGTLFKACAVHAPGLTLPGFEDAA
ncbi:MAG TPA: SAM-dependent methyltransferase [Caulobacteraceae bacterium]|nr:SAM-dependent methyltransferase [Caulobacteraceae bacterium]